MRAILFALFILFSIVLADRSFVISGDAFVKDGQPYTIISGKLILFRIIPITRRLYTLFPSSPFTLDRSSRQNESGRSQFCRFFPSYIPYLTQSRLRLMYLGTCTILSMENTDSKVNMTWWNFWTRHRKSDWMSFLGRVLISVRVSWSDHLYSLWDEDWLCFRVWIWRSAFLAPQCDVSTPSIHRFLFSCRCLKISLDTRSKNLTTLVDSNWGPPNSSTSTFTPLIWTSSLPNFYPFSIVKVEIS